MKQGWLVAFPKTFPKEDCPVAKSCILQLDTKQSESQFKDEDRETGVKKSMGINTWLLPCQRSHF